YTSCEAYEKTAAVPPVYVDKILFSASVTAERDGSFIVSWNMLPPPEATVSVTVPGARLTGTGSRMPLDIDLPCTIEPGQSTSALGFNATNLSGTSVRS